jgi:predicted ester cyclase
MKDNMTMAQDMLDANKRRARDYFTAFATQDRDWLQANVAPGYVRRDTTLPFAVVGPEGVLRLGDVLLGAFSEVELDIQDVIAEADKVLVHLRFRGVHSGPFGDYPASGRRFDVMVLDFFRMEDGMIAEQWPAIDNLGLQQQIGMLPS